VGCSGWSYQDWRGVVYPAKAPTTAWFAAYAERFDTVELNTTFYRLPRATTVEQWAAQAPDGFLYALKVGAFGTHRKKLTDPESWLANHLDRACRLGDHLGPNLFQLPPRWRRNTARLDELLSVAPKTIRWAVELRDPSWIDDDVFAVLSSHGAALCLHDLLPQQPWIRTTDWTYVRFHGPAAETKRYHDRYGARRLSRTAERLQGWLDEGTDVYAYFNNDHGGAAVLDAEWLAGALTDRRFSAVTAPPPVASGTGAGRGGRR
jgi:uncharacterized protein YecE (DUF72 family)